MNNSRMKRMSEMLTAATNENIKKINVSLPKYAQENLNILAERTDLARHFWNNSETEQYYDLSISQKKLAVDYLKQNAGIFYTPLIHNSIGRFMTPEQRRLLKRRILESIAVEYPDLSQEVKKQLTVLNI